MTPTSTYRLEILKLHCYRQEEEDGDEVFLRMEGNKIWPGDSKYVKIREGEKTVGHTVNNIEKGSYIVIELWDWDLLSPNDKLGEFSLLINERGGPFTTDLKASSGEEAKYSLEWEVY